MRININKASALLFLVAFVITAMLACKKSEGTKEPPVNGNVKFPLTNLSLKVVSSEVNSDYVEINYEVKNISNKNYKFYESNPHIGIRLSITATDGTVYQEKRLLTDDIIAGKTNALSAHVDYTKGKTITVSKNKVELFYDE